ncbi:MAG TPA: DJ-1/PfpI family protein [Spirochaetota bacterium]|nr:DJ-1/PfpI family protein [Spirochaetota bacterium]
MKNTGILIFDDIELLDFAGPYEVFSVTNELNDYSLCRTFTVEENGKVIRSVNGLKVIPDYSFADCPDIDILIIPGGVGTKKLLERDQVLKWILQRSESSEITFSVCSGSRLLGKIGLLDNLEYITHHDVIKDMPEIAPMAIAAENKRFVDCGKILTSAGISAGIDLSLYVVEKIFGNTTMRKTRTYMEYGDWEN